MFASVIVVLLLLLVLAAVVSPWRWPQTNVEARADERRQAAVSEVLDLEAARDAKYREIRDAELDRETRKLSDQDFQAVDSALRGEAVEILKRLDRAQGRLQKRRSSQDAEELGEDVDEAELGPGLNTGARAEAD